MFFDSDFYESRDQRPLRLVRRFLPSEDWLEMGVYLNILSYKQVCLSQSQSEICNTDLYSQARANRCRLLKRQESGFPLNARYPALLEMTKILVGH